MVRAKNKRVAAFLDPIVLLKGINPWLELDWHNYNLTNHILYKVNFNYYYFLKFL